jgi:hypothetical protein
MNENREVEPLAAAEWKALVAMFEAGEPNEEERWTIGCIQEIY